MMLTMRSHRYSSRQKYRILTDSIRQLKGRHSFAQYITHGWGMSALHLRKQFVYSVLWCHPRSAIIMKLDGITGIINTEPRNAENVLLVGIEYLISGFIIHYLTEHTYEDIRYSLEATFTDEVWLTLAHIWLIAFLVFIDIIIPPCSNSKMKITAWKRKHNPTFNKESLFIHVLISSAVKLILHITIKITKSHTARPCW